jgi:hypothetical protein
MVIDDDEDVCCSTYLSTECSCTINRHGFIFDFAVYLFESEERKNIGWSCYYNVFDLIMISRNNDNGHPSFYYHSLQLNSSAHRYRRNNHSIRYNTSKFYFVLILFDRFDTLQFDLIQYD